MDFRHIHLHLVSLLSDIGNLSNVSILDNEPRLDAVKEHELVGRSDYYADMSAKRWSYCKTSD